MPHSEEHKELFSLLEGDDRFKFNQDVGSLGQSFDSTFDLGEGSPITRRATPASSRSFNDDKKAALSNIDFLIPKPPTNAGIVDVRSEFSNFGTETFNPPLRETPDNPLEEGATSAGGVNTPQISLLLSSLGQAIGGDSIGGRIAGAAQQFAQRKITANLSEKILNGERLTAEDLLGLDPQTALKIKAAQAAEVKTEREFALKEQGADLGDTAETRLASESESRTRLRDEQLKQIRSDFAKQESFNPQDYFDAIGSIPEIDLDLSGTDFSQLEGLTIDQAEGIMQSLLSVREARLGRESGESEGKAGRKSRESIAAGRTAGSAAASGGGSFQEKQFKALEANPSTIPYLTFTRTQIEAELKDEDVIDDPSRLRLLTQQMAEIDNLLLRLGENPLNK